MLSKTRKTIKRKHIESLQGVLFTFSVIIGVIVFTYVPAIQSLIYSFFKYDGFSTMQFRGFRNYIDIFMTDKETAKAFGNTFLYAVVTVPLSLVLGYFTALLLNSKLKGVSAFRVLFYMPVVIPTVAAGVLWRDMFNSEFGIMNRIIGVFGWHGTFFESADTAMATLIFTTVWGVGGGMIVWLSAFKNIPTELYESAKLDGANAWHRMVRITIPMSTPMIFYNLVTGIVGALQVYNTMIIAGGRGTGPEDSLLFIGVKIYNDAFRRAGRMGYACAFGWLLFLVIAVLIAVIFKTGKWVQYNED